jgi:nucleotide-binding universal stress UspA family protein
VTNRILVPVDGSEHATTAVEYVVETFPDTTIVLLHVINPAEAGYGAEAVLSTIPEDWYEKRHEDATELLDKLAAESRTAGVEEIEQVTETGRPTQVIVDYATDHEIDQIVMGSHGRSGIERILLGSVAETVMRRATVPVTVVR